MARVKDKAQRLGEDIAIGRFKQAIASGKHWYLALLEAVGLWSKTSETHEGREYRYLIDGEAFDWLLLAERLCQAANGLIPEDQKNALLFQGRPPLDLATEQFKGLIGEAKYRQHLNFFYGVTVEEAINSAVQEEIQKERVTSGYCRPVDHTNEAHRRIYGATRTQLLRRFRNERGHPQTDSISIAELKQFTYWLFKYRLGQSEKCKLGSDTKKGLDYMERHNTMRSAREARY